MNTLTAMVSRARERQSIEQTIFCRELPGDESMRDPYFKGNASVYVPRGRVRFIKRSETIDLAPGLREIPSHIPRDYFAVLGLRGARRKSYDHYAAIRDILEQKPAFPAFTTPAQFDDGFYVDIIKCWFSVLLAVGWNPSYNPGHWLTGGYRPFDFPFPNSRTRDMLVTLALPRPIRMYYPGKSPQDKNIPFPFGNPTISALMRDTLHTISDQARSLGAVWGSMDGFVCPSYNTARDVSQMVRDWGLDVAVKGRGAGRVVRHNCYSVGDKKTVLQDAEPRPTNNVREIEHARWLQDRVAGLAALKSDFAPRPVRDAPVKSILDFVEV